MQALSTIQSSILPTHSLSLVQAGSIQRSLTWSLHIYKVQVNPSCLNYLFISQYTDGDRSFPDPDPKIKSPSHLICRVIKWSPYVMRQL